MTSTNCHKIKLLSFMRWMDPVFFVEEKRSCRSYYSFSGHLFNRTRVSSFVNKNRVPAQGHSSP